MKNRSDGRNFLKNVTAGSAAAILPIAGIASEKQSEGFKKSNNPDDSKRQYNGSYSGQYLNRIAFPIGGIGAGMICMEGTGAISHVSVRNKPEIFNEPGIFAAIHVKGIKNGAKVLEGPVPDWKKFGLKDAGNGLTGSTT